jgi:hypothetical protein
MRVCTRVIGIVQRNQAIKRKTRVGIAAAITFVPEAAHGGGGRGAGMLRRDIGGSTAERS